MSAVRVFCSRHPSSCRIETQSGTIYWFSAPDSDHVRDVYRESPDAGGPSSTLKVAAPQARTDDPKVREGRFRCTILNDVEVGKSLILKPLDESCKVLSEAVTSIETTEVPAALFADSP